MKILVACEYSGAVRDALRARGHFAVSCDIIASEKPGPHIQADVLTVLDWGWDAMIAFPPCTYLANSGVRWLYEREGRLQQMAEGARFWRAVWDAPIPLVAIENPIMHKHAKNVIGIGLDVPDYAQIIQPWQFGHGETKATCLWLRGLPKLQPTHIVAGREARVHRMSPGANRGHERARTYPGVAEAMAEQWFGNALSSLDIA